MRCIQKGTENNFKSYLSHLKCIKNHKDEFLEEYINCINEYYSDFETKALDKIALSKLLKERYKISDDGNEIFLMKYCLAQSKKNFSGLNLIKVYYKSGNIIIESSDESVCEIINEEIKDFDVGTIFIKKEYKNPFSEGY